MHPGLDGYLEPPSYSPESISHFFPHDAYITWNLSFIPSGLAPLEHQRDSYTNTKLHIIMNYSENAPALHDINPKLHRDSTLEEGFCTKPWNGCSLQKEQSTG